MSLPGLPWRLQQPVEIFSNGDNAWCPGIVDSPASPPHYMYNPVKTIKTNTVGTVNMLGLAKRTKARILIASTSEVS